MFGTEPQHGGAVFLTPGGWLLAAMLAFVIGSIWRVGSKLGGMLAAARTILEAAKTERGTAELVRADAKTVAAEVVHTAAKVAATTAASVAAVKVAGSAAGGGSGKSNNPDGSGQ